MTKIIVSLLLALPLVCGDCGGTHKVLEVGTVTKTQNDGLEITMIDGNTYSWYIEGNNLKEGDTIVSFGCNVYKLK